MSKGLHTKPQRGSNAVYPGVTLTHDYSKNGVRRNKFVVNPGKINIYVNSKRTENEACRQAIQIRKQYESLVNQGKTSCIQINPN